MGDGKVALTGRVRLGAVCWMLTVEFFLTQLVAQLGWPAYRLVNNDISLLGATVCGIKNPAPHGIGYVCSPLNLVFSLGVVAVGVLIVMGAIFTRPAWPRGRVAAFGLVLLGLGGVGGVLVGVFPFNVRPGIHSLGAGINFVLGNIGVIAMGAALWRHRRGLGAYSIVTGLVCLVATGLYASGSEFLGRGILERLAAYPQTVWFMAMGTLLVLGEPLAGPQRAGISAG